MTWRSGTLADFMGDFVVYRNLEPTQDGIRGLRASWSEIGLDHYYVPRKVAPEYARALFHYLQQGQAQRGVAQPVQYLLFIGDTLMLDGTAARNLAGYAPMHGFVGADRLSQPARIELQGELMVANRWAALADFMRWAVEHGVPLDERTALLIDLDKTSLGARGRNDKVIDEARVQAVLRTMRAALEDRFEEAAFRAVYDPLNQPEYHPFTADNQDYLAYVCLMVLGNVCPVGELWRDLASGALVHIDQFVERCDARSGSMSAGLLEAHMEVRKGIAAEDPTPFKAFRRTEYLETIRRMNSLPGNATAEETLRREIVITAEVASVAASMAAQGVLVFGISDKPDEASLPTEEQRREGYQALHHTRMKIYGQDLA